MAAAPPYRIETERLVVRCWDPTDAPLLKDAIDSSLDHLRPWLPWARAEPRPLSEKVELLRRFRRGFELGTDFVYGIFGRDESEVVGGTGLHTRVGDGAFEIGYWIRVSRAGAGLATEAVEALTRVAFEVCGVVRLEIHVDPANAPSARIPQKLGYAQAGTHEGHTVFSLAADEFAGSGLVRFPVEAYDAAGARLI